MPDSVTILELISSVLRGQVRIPSFQRGFVWDAERVAHLMDSIYKGYPFGTLLIWRTKTPLQTERQLGPFRIPPGEPDYPVDYILDGQQRATSIFGVFQSALPASPSVESAWTDIYFDILQDDSEQEPQFYYLPEDQVDGLRHFPLKILFNPPQYHKYLHENYKEGSKVSDKLAALHARFSAAKVPIQTLETDNRAAVAIVFERINRLGVKLDTLQLLSAWSWSEEFDLQQQFGGLQEEVQKFHYGEVAADTDLLLRTCVAVIMHETSAKATIELRGSEIRRRFNEVRRGLLGAIDFLITQMKITTDCILPNRQIIVPLSVFFASEREQGVVINDTQRTSLLNWAWSIFFSGPRASYSRGKEIDSDIKEILNLKRGDNHLLNNNTEVVGEYFFRRRFNANTAAGRVLISMLMNAPPLDFVSGSELTASEVLHQCNSKEYHHIFPRASLEGTTITVLIDEIDGQQITMEEPADPDMMSNICVITRGSNNKIGEDTPSLYRKFMPTDITVLHNILNHSFCPHNMFSLPYHEFTRARAELLAAFANHLTGGDKVSHEDPEIPF